MGAIKVEYKITTAGLTVLVARMKDLHPVMYEYNHDEDLQWNMTDAAREYLKALADDNESWGRYELGDGGLLDEDTMVFVPQTAPKFN